jgi:predicted HicB family RNase H-like nuclease
LPLFFDYLFRPNNKKVEESFGVQQNFNEAVDNFLAYCTDEGISPNKSYTGVLNVRLTI